MNEAGISTRLARSLHFFGRITANLSHEMNNVVTIIGEVSGLLDDLLLLAEKGRPLDTEKLKSLSENIKRQTRRGKEIITEMNFLGHSIDDASRQIDLNLVADHIGSLARRIAERKGGVLEVKRFDQPVMAVCNPFDLLQSIFWCLDMALAAGAVSEPVCIAASMGAHGPCVSVCSSGFEHSDPDRATLSDIGMLLIEAGGTVTTAIDDHGRRVIQLQFPPVALDAAAAP
jgi:C4-dicarboxylate-specific signal transduction histidine kinase